MQDHLEVQMTLLRALVALPVPETNEGLTPERARKIILQMRSMIENTLYAYDHQDKT